MPTGYTNIIDSADGDLPLRPFLIRCAFAFGYLARHDSYPGDTLPDAVVPPDIDYHREERRKAADSLARLADMSAKECNAHARADHARVVKSYADSRKSSRAMAAKYDAMRAKVKAWTPPTPDHEQLRTFMLSQLDTGNPYTFNEPDPTLPTGAEWRAAKAKNYRRELAYHEAEIAKWEEWTVNGNAWLAALKGSLDDAPPDTKPSAV